MKLIHIFFRLFWNCILLCCLYGSISFANNILNKFLNTSTIITIPSQHLPTNNVPFPGITICTPNEIKESNIEKVMKSFSWVSLHFCSIWYFIIKQLKIWTSFRILPDNVTIDEVRKNMHLFIGPFPETFDFNTNTLQILDTVLKNNRYTVGKNN